MKVLADMKSTQDKIIEVILIVSFKIIIVSSAPRLTINNDGPATLGANVTFTTLLEGFTPKRSLNYVFTDGVQNAEYSGETTNMTLSLKYTQDLYKEGSYCMNVTVEESKLFRQVKIAANHTCFQLKRDLIGQIFVYQNNVSSNGADEVAVGDNVTFALKLHDPSGFLDSAAVEYGWSVDMERDPSALGSALIYNFTDPGLKEIKAVATALFPNNVFKYGIFKKIVTAKVPVNSVNISGNPFLHHGDLLHLNVSCHGTPPFVYCSEILKENTTMDNFTCSQLSTFSTCHMVIKKFLLDGKYRMGIYISNDVREVKRVLEVMVYNVSIKPTLSTVIIPIVCSLLTLMIIAVGISFCIQQRNQLAIEVANFDFQDDSDSYTERTFFEKILDSFTCRTCPSNRFSCNRSESDPLLSDAYDPHV